MESFVYLVGAVYLAASVARLMFWAVDMIERKRWKIFWEAEKMKKEYCVNVVMFGGPERLACIVSSNSLKNAVRQIKAKPPFSGRSVYYIFESGKYAEGVSITC